MMPYSELLIYATSYFGLLTSIFFLITFFEKKTQKHHRLKNYPTVCIIVPCFNEESRVEKTLTSLLALDYPKDKIEIIAVDDGSTDNTLQVLNNFKKSGIKVLHKENGGKHTALNLGLANTNAEFVGALDADSYVDKRALKRILSRFTKKEIMATTPAMLISQPRGILRRIQSVEFYLGVFLREVFTRLGSQHVTPGPFTIYRKEFFDKYGHFKNAYNTEDMEVSLRINKHNFIIENAPDAYVYTHGPSTFKKLHHQRVRWYNGFLHNILDYKELFHIKYGNLGIFILPSAVLSIILLLMNFFNTIFLTASSAHQRLNNLIAVNFDISAFKLNFDPFYINTNSLVMIALTSITIAVFMIFFAKKLVNEKKSIKLSFAFFFLFYAVLFSYWWFMVLVYKVFRVPVGWKAKGKD